MPETKKSPRRVVIVLMCTALAVASASGIMLWVAGLGTNINADLITAAKTGNAIEIKDLLENGADPNARELNEAEPPTSNLIAMLIFRYNHRNAQNNRGDTALTCALNSLHPYESAKVLLEHGAHANAGGDKGAENVAVAAIYGRPAVVDLLIEHGASTQLISNSYDHMRADMRLLLANHGAQVPPADSKHIRTNPVYRGSTPNPHDAEFFDAVKRDDLSTVRRLLAEGEDYYTENKEGASALDLAAYYGHTDLLSLFIQAGADASDVNHSSRKSPLEYAIDNPANVPTRLEAIRIILEHGNTLPPRWVEKFVKQMNANNINQRDEIVALLKQHMEAEHAPAPLQHLLPGPHL